MSVSLSIPAGRVGVFWFEQNHFLLQGGKTVQNGGDVRIHVDPFLSRVVKPENHVHPRPLIRPGEATADLVFLTHDHRDHTDPYTLGPIAAGNPECLFVGSPESCDRCVATGIDEERVRRVAAGESVEARGVTVDVVDAENTGDTDCTTHLGFVFRFPAATIYVTGDTRVDPAGYRDTFQAVCGLKPDLLAVPINEGYNNPGPFGAAALVELVDPAFVVPCHFGCFRNNTIDPGLFVDALPDARRDRVVVLDRGGTIVVPR